MGSENFRADGVACNLFNLNYSFTDEGAKIGRLYFLPQLTWFFKKKNMKPVFFFSDFSFRALIFIYLEILSEDPFQYGNTDFVQ